MDINELIRISEEAERRRRMLGGVDAFDQIAKRQALFDAAERNIKISLMIVFWKLKRL